MSFHALMPIALAAFMNAPSVRVGVGTSFLTQRSFRMNEKASVPAPRTRKYVISCNATRSARPKRKKAGDSDAAKVNAAAAVSSKGGHIPGALVLNADFTPLSYLPLSVWSWQETLRLVLRGAANVVAEHDCFVRSPKMKMAVPSVVVLKNYVSYDEARRKPALTRRNLYLRDGGTCQYCDRSLGVNDLTFDHVHPRSHGGVHSWENVVCSCAKCNNRKGSRLLEHMSDMKLKRQPRRPSSTELYRRSREVSPHAPEHEDWEFYI